MPRPGRLLAAPGGRSPPSARTAKADPRPRARSMLQAAEVSRALARQGSTGDPADQRQPAPLELPRARSPASQQAAQAPASMPKSQQLKRRSEPPENRLH